MSILNNWNTKEKEPLLAKVKDKVTPQPPLRNRVETTQRAMQTLISRLDQKQSRLKSPDTALFDKVVEATQKHDKNYKLFVNDCKTRENNPKLEYLSSI